MTAPPLKTYSHLAAQRRMPTEYEIATTRLLPYLERGFEVNVPLAAWYRQHQQGSPLGEVDWETFRDPAETTYAKYTQVQASREAHVDGIFESIAGSDYDRTLTPAWMDVLERGILPLRYPFHGLQMAAAYVGQLAPAGRIAIVSLFQCADEMRRIQRIAYRMAQLRAVRPGFGDGSRALWQSGPEWQPLRTMVERLLVTYDWGEAFTVLDLCLKPLLDELVLAELPALARTNGDYHLGEIFYSLRQDVAWHRAWVSALVAVAIAGRAANRDVLRGWTRRALPAAEESVVALAGLLGPGGPEAATRACASVRDALSSLGVAP